METNPFCKELESVFVVGSPFQTLCAISTIKNLEISSYELIVINTDRFYQVKQIIERYGLSYHLKDVGKYRWRMRLYKIAAINRKYGKYNRLFIGDYRSETLLFYGLNNVSDGATVVYIDDGNVSISLFKNTNELKINKYLQFISKRRNFTLFKHFYTIYRNIPNLNLNIEYNNLRLLSKGSSTNKGIFFVGTNTFLYCKSLGIEVEKFYQILDSQLKEIKLRIPDEHMFYIPHGKDISEEVKRICLSNNIQYERLNVPIEMIFQTINTTPTQVYGFTSSALYNIKQMFPDCMVYNILIDPNNNCVNYEEYISVSQYYNENGIIQIDVHI